jgi:release factor glutamine methyltransferase
LIANAPYVPTESIALMPPEARLYEPRVALDGGADGLDIQRRVAQAAPQWLAPGGRLLIETSQAQAQHTVDAMVGHGLVTWVATSDEMQATVVIGSKPAATGQAVR